MKKVHLFLQFGALYQPVSRWPLVRERLEENMHKVRQLLREVLWQRSHNSPDQLFCQVAYKIIPDNRCNQVDEVWSRKSQL